MERFLVFSLFFAINVLVVFAQQDIAPSQDKLITKTSFDTPPKILHKPKPSWGEGQDCSTGTVILRIEFLAEGKIGRIAIVKGMTKNRNEESLKAARKIRFRPAKKDGQNVTAFRQIEFSFSIY